ncbi:caspase family protein [Spirosoma fluviale]|uniref:Uncharacterized protein, contains caspase domain n=1 Tax=Spirosoma fluviale TaxID=1597977 RepID=A0A286F906_9BACT|nr:caspase family protein [Spirosoma fluviale]SOD79479.1 Uncharacterized protein, contains caspase domain [Spirosoma fluviale]
MLTKLLLAFGLLLSSQQQVFAGQTYAVVVGISDYEALSYATGDLRFADRDARQFAAFLQSKSGGSVPAANIRLLTNRQATQAAILQQLNVFRQATEADRIILYFSGHGMPDSFVPYDVVPGNPAGLLTYRDIKAAFYQSSATTKLCIADACLSGGMSRKGVTQRNSGQIVTQNTADRSNVAMILASRSTQSAVEDGRLGGGAFTYFLLRGLSGQADLNGNGIVTIKELHQYISPQLKKRTQGRQTPMFYGRFSDNLPLAYH